MARQICLAQPETVNPDGTCRTFSILERAPIRLPEHLDHVWELLRESGREQLVIDAKDPKEAFLAKVVETAVLARPDVDKAMSRARKASLEAEGKNDGASVFSNDLDEAFNQQREWLQLRTVISQATRAKKTAKRVMLLID